MLDFRNRGFVLEYTELIARFMAVGQGILEHGACSSMQWDSELRDFLTDAEWAQVRPIFDPEGRPGRPER